MHASTPFHAAVAALRDANLCDNCQKTRFVVNVAPYRQPGRPERITRDTHCGCTPDSPAWELPKGTDELVEFDGEMTTWGALMLQDQKTVKRDADGVLRGGYGF